MSTSCDWRLRNLWSLISYSPNVKPTEKRWGLHSLAEGKHTLRLECMGKSGESSGYFLGFDLLNARIPAYQRPPGFDLRNVE